MANFAAYQSRGQLAAPEVHFTKPVGVSYDNPGERALARVNADTAGVIVKGYENWKEQYDSGKVMEANNEYNRLMSEGTAELMQKKQENALNIVQDYDKLHQKALDQVRKKFGAFINYGKAGQAFNIYTERDNNTRRNNMMKYQIAETEAYHETQYNNQLATCMDIVGAGGYSDAAIAEGLNRAEPLVRQRYAQYGEEMVQNQMRVAKGQMVGAALQFAVNTQDYTRMGELASKYNNYLDPKTRVSVLSMLGTRQKDAHESAQAKYLYASLGRNATWEDVRQRVVENMQNQSGLQGLFSQMQNLCGVTMDNGRNGCVEFCMKSLDGFTRFGTNNAEQRNVGMLCRAAQAENSGATLLRYNGQGLRAGDIIVYATPGDDISDFDNLEHVTISDGNGGYYGNSSSAKDYEDENGNYVRGNGCGVHSDNQEIGGYEIAYVIRPDDITAKEMTDLEIDEQTNRLYAQIEKQRNREIAVENQIIQQGKLEMQDLKNQGIMDVAQYQAIADKYAYSNGVVNDNIRISLEEKVAAIEKQNETATRQAARNRPSEKVSEADKDYLRSELAKGEGTDTDITRYCTEKGITSEEQINKLMKIRNEWAENKGEFAIDYDYIETQCGIDPKHFADKDAFHKAIKKTAQWEYKVMRAENNGRLQDGWEDALAKRVSDDMTKYVVGGTYTDKGTWFNTEEQTKIPVRALISNGFRMEWEQTGDDGYILYTQNGEAVYKTGEEIRNMVDRFGYIE